MTILKKGYTGPQVLIVQEFLKDEGYYHGSLDSVFGPSMDNAVKRFQRDNGLVADGVIGNRTYEKFREHDFEKDGTELDAFGISEKEIRDIIDQNSYHLIAQDNKYNPFPTVFDPDNHVIAVAIRGFNLSMGVSGKNDRRIFDDAHFLVTPDEIRPFAGNTDPNGYRKGYGYGSKKGMACLKKGVWFFGTGPHKGSPAFRQCVPFTVERDGNPNYDHTGYHAINWHSAGVRSTSSLGCQTNRPNDFIQIRNFLYAKMNVYDNPYMQNDWNQRVRSLPYILIEETDRRAGKIKL